MNDLDWLLIYAAVLATLALGWNIISYVLNIIRNRPGIKLGSLCLTEWTTHDPKIEFRATNHKQEPIKVECFGFMMPGEQEFHPYAPPPESAVVPARDYRKFTISIKHIRELYKPEVRSSFKFIFIKDTTGRHYKMKIPKSMVREIATSGVTK